MSVIDKSRLLLFIGGTVPVPGVSAGDLGALATKNAVGTLDIADKAVTLSRMADRNPATFLGRRAGGGLGPLEELSDVQARAVLDLGSAALAAAEDFASAEQGVTPEDRELLVDLDQSFDLDGEDFVVRDPVGFRVIKLTPDELELLGEKRIDFSPGDDLQVVDPLGFEIVSLGMGGIRVMGKPFAVDVAADLAQLSGITQTGPRQIQRWRAALGGVIAGIGRARVLCVGDSNTMGHSAIPAGHRRALSYPAALAKLGGTFSATAANVIGSALPGTEAPTVAAYRTYDPRVTAAASGWSLGGPASAGGFMWLNTTTTGAIEFAPGEVWDTAEVWVDLDAGARVEIGTSGARVGHDASPGSIQRLVFTKGAPSTAPLEIARVTGTVRVIGWHCSDSTRPGVDVISAGRSSWRSDQYADDAGYSAPLRALSAFGADLWLLQLGLNDCNQGRSPALFRASMELILDAAASLGVPVVIIVSLSPGISPTYPWAAYRAELYDLAALYDCPLIDVGTRFGPYADGLADELIANTLHPTARGYADMALACHSLLFK